MAPRPKKKQDPQSFIGTPKLNSIGENPSIIPPFKGLEGTVQKQLGDLFNNNYSITGFLDEIGISGKNNLSVNIKELTLEKLKELLIKHQITQNDFMQIYVGLLMKSDTFSQTLRLLMSKINYNGPDSIKVSFDNVIGHIQYDQSAEIDYVLLSKDLPQPLSITDKIYGTATFMNRFNQIVKCGWLKYLKGLNEFRKALKISDGMFDDFINDLNTVLEIFENAISDTKILDLEKIKYQALFSERLKNKFHDGFSLIKSKIQGILLTIGEELSDSEKTQFMIMINMIDSQISVNVYRSHFDKLDNDIFDFIEHGLLKLYEITTDSGLLNLITLNKNMKNEYYLLSDFNYDYEKIFFVLSKSKNGISDIDMIKQKFGIKSNKVSKFKYIFECLMNNLELAVELRNNGINRINNVEEVFLMGKKRLRLVKKN